ncbi:GNAT family N-acetyltransferase [Klebsiella michiganensis]|uniref:GNAT family N-acetyltransferase n=1 Tax=Klebsiella michiganensis TaxID=1134687 RepID=UPI001EF7DC53|nr:GNAT family N-acetyltransferase [Klebsiella michiganensis]
MIEIRAFQRQDGEGISALFRTVYGDRYVYPDIYMPSLIGWRNARDEWHSAIAEQNGIIIGHAALWRHHADKQTAELAMFAVHPRLQKPGRSHPTGGIFASCRKQAWPGHANHQNGIQPSTLAAPGAEAGLLLNGVAQRLRPLPLSIRPA